MPPTRTARAARLARLAAASLTTSLIAIAAAQAGAARDHGAVACPPAAAPLRLAQATPAADPKAAKAPEKPSAKEVAREVAALLQSCSYDGAPLRIDQSALGSPTQGDARAMVAAIMKFTGLPQNFDVVEGPAPNAAALIVLGKDKTPRRVIAYNPKFMEIVRAATQNSDWASISIMAHEIGHHLSGHTLLPGGSQPPIELEADKFSGFVLNKMGAGLPDALKAMNALVKDGPDGPTHPGRARRVAAIASGWTEACEQAGRTNCAGGAAVAVSAPAAAPAPIAAAPAPGAAGPATAGAAASGRDTAAGRVAIPAAPGQPSAGAAGTASVLPGQDPAATPSKFSRFIHDEYGLLDAATVQRFETLFFEHARDTGVEIVTLIVKDFDGLEPDAYAQAMMRQMRVGKLDVGNGVVFAIAPEKGATGVALGPGVMGAVKSHLANYRKSADSLDATSFDYCREKKRCSGPMTETVLYWPDHVRRDTGKLDWTIRYPSFADLFAVYKTEFEAFSRGGAYDPAKSQVWRRIARLDAVVDAVDLTEKDRQVNAAILRDGYRAVRGKGSGGEIFNFYVLPTTPPLQPIAALEPGKRYSFVARQMSLSTNPKDAQSFEVLSYALVE